MRLSITQLTVFLTLLHQSDSADVPCTNMPEGLKKLSQGVDITRLDLHPLDFTSQNGFVGKILDFTCNQGKLWRDPYSGKNYSVPDQVWVIFSQPGGLMDSTVSTYKSSLDVKKSMAFNVGVDVLEGAFSASGSYKRLSDLVKNNTVYVKDIESFVSTWIVQFIPSSILVPSSEVQSELEKLPNRYSDNPEEFRQFIIEYGTHYLYKGSFGGALRNVYKTDSSYYSSHKDWEVSVQAERSFLKDIKFGGNGNFSGSVLAVDDKFESLTSNETGFYGGYSNVFKERGAIEWQPTVAKNPWILGGKLRPITDLVPSSRKREALKRAIEVHLDKAFLDELSAELTSCKDKSRLQSELDQMRETSNPDHDEVVKLGLFIRSDCIGVSVSTGTASNREPELDISNIFPRKKVTPPQSGALCSNIPTGLNKLSLGVDITRLDTQPLNFNAPDGFMSPVLDFTCEQNNIWNGFQEPDQVDIYDDPRGVIRGEVKTFKTKAKFKDHLAANVDVDNIPIPFKGGLFSASGSYKHFSEVIQNESLYVSEVRATVYSFIARFGVSLKSSSIFTAYLECLPNTFKDDPQSFLGFISYFGTHFFYEANFGGIQRAIFETDARYYSSHDESDLSGQVDATWSLVKLGGDYDKTAKEIDTKFSSATHGKILYYGGESNFLSTNGRKNWQDTVRNNSWIIGGSLKKITDLIPESHNSKKDALDTAIKVYIQQAFMKELLDQYTNVVGLSQYLNGLMSEDLVQQSETIPDPRLGGLMHWQHTELVYEFNQKAYGDGFELLKTSAPVNSYTNWSTHSGEMNWYINTPHPEFYKAVRLCVDDESADCAELTVTRGYRKNEYVYTQCLPNDDCWFRLQLRVSHDAPTWMHNLKLCYQWRQMPGGGNCVKHGARYGEVCAVANTWTEKYHYTQDNRETKCQIRFRILFSEYFVSKEEALETFWRNELQDEIEKFKKVYSIYGNLTKYLDDYKSEGDNQLSRATPDYDKVSELKESVSSLKDWHTTYFDYYFNQKACGDGSYINFTYAPVNSYTYWSTHSRHMEWGIVKPYYNAITAIDKGLQLCNQDHDDRSNEYDCADSPYADSDCQLGQFCWFKLKLYVPRDLPTWMHSLKLCYQWRQAKGGNCVKNGTRSGEVCAFANSWTEKYHYTQDNRETKCEIRFGIFNT